MLYLIDPEQKTDGAAPKRGLPKNAAWPPLPQAFIGTEKCQGILGKRLIRNLGLQQRETEQAGRRRG